jgi:nucleotide-binding universal stress UspA family protein
VVEVKTILAPTDLRSTSMPAMDEAIRVAESFGADVIFMHVFESLHPRVGLLCEDVERPGYSWLDPEQRAVADRYRRMPVQVHYTIGECASSVTDAARDLKADLNVIKTHVQSRRRRLLTASTTGSVLTSAPCPVWAGTDDCFVRPRTGIRRILCALALAPGNDRVLHWASSLALRFDAELSIAHVDSTLRPVALKQLSDGVLRTQPPVSLHVEHGQPVEAIRTIADRTGADLLVIGRSPARRLFAGLPTRAYEFARAMPCPVASC